MIHRTLEATLAGWSESDSLRQAVARTVIALATTGIAIADLIAAGTLAGEMAKVRGFHGDGDSQKELDARADTLIADALRQAPVAVLGSEEADEPLVLNAEAPLAVAVDPLDGSSNIDTNVTVGTIFSILPNTGPNPLLQPGSCQLAAGFLVYGPQVALLLTVGAGTDIFVLDRSSGQFLLAREQVEIPAEASEYAINASNVRHWSPAIRNYVNDCLAGSEGPRGKDFNMRWIASMVADAYRIFARGGVYLYPGDSRKGYASGRLRLVYEANPLAFLVEQARGKATDGVRPILDIIPAALHQRVPLVFGSRGEVERIARYKLEPDNISDRSPLFGRRGLLRA